jgi:hypothetical protein
MRLVVFVTALVVGLASPATASASGSDETGIEAFTLPVSLDRIKRRLEALLSEDQRLVLRLTERVDVYARELAMEILHDFNVKSWASLLGGRTGGAIAYGSPTHNEMMQAMTPAFWQQQAASMGWLGFGW